MSALALTAEALVAWETLLAQGQDGFSGICAVKRADLRRLVHDARVAHSMQAMPKAADQLAAGVAEYKVGEPLRVTPRDLARAVFTSDGYTAVSSLAQDLPNLQRLVDITILQLAWAALGRQVEIDLGNGRALSCTAGRASAQHPPGEGR